jgi:hypothetical protein
MRSASSSVSPRARCTGSVSATNGSYPLRGNGSLYEPGITSNTVFMPATKKRSKAPMSSEHKEALALGREQGRAVRRYLEALELHKPKRGRKRTAESVQKQLAAIEDKVATADPLTRVQLIQQRMDLQRELASKGETVDLGALESDFVRAAKDYGQRKGISYAAWREAGVDAAVLKKAGIPRSA